MRVSGDECEHVGLADAFYRIHRDRAVAWATALTGRADVGEELAQDALLRTIERLDDVRDPAAYLRVAVANACRSWHRSRHREEVRAHRARGSDDAHDEWLSPSSFETLRLLDDLPYRHRAALLLRFWAGWSDSEIADALGCRRVSVRVYVHRGLQALRAVMEEEPS